MSNSGSDSCTTLSPIAYCLGWATKPIKFIASFCVRTTSVAPSFEGVINYRLILKIQLNLLSIAFLNKSYYIVWIH